MTALSTTSFPSSFQLRLAFGDKRTTRTVVFLRTRVHELRRVVRLTSVAQSSVIQCNGLEGRRGDDSWVVNSNSSVDGFSGWISDKQEAESNGKQPLKEILGAGLAAGVLVAGLLVVALSLGRRSRSKIVQMKPLIPQPEASEVCSDQENLVEEGENEKKNDTQEGSPYQSTTDIDRDMSTSIKSINASEVTYGERSDTDCIPTNLEASAPLQKVSPEELTVNVMSFASEESSTQINSQEGDNTFAGLSSRDKDTSILHQKPDTMDESEAGKVSFSADGIVENPDHDSYQVRHSIQENEDLNLTSDLSQREHATGNISVVSEFDVLNSDILQGGFRDARGSWAGLQTFDIDSARDIPTEQVVSALPNKSGTESPFDTLVSNAAYTPTGEQIDNVSTRKDESRPSVSSSNPGSGFGSAGIPAPSTVTACLLAVPGKVLVPAVTDQVQLQALAALQALKVIEADAQPGEICTRREYARWLVSASSALSRSSVSKVYPAMYIENVTELAFDDITAEDPDFSSIQGLAEAGLISSKLSRRDTQGYDDDDPGSIYFSPESPLSRQDLVSWKMALERKQLTLVERKKLQEVSGFIDVDKINPDAWPALVADLSAGEQGIVALAFGYTRLFQPDKPVTKAQAAVALTVGEASDVVGEELARIEAESMAEKVVAAQNALVAQVEEEVNATYEKELLLEREKVRAIEKLAEAARHELDMLRAQREEENLSLMKERAAVDSEMEVLSKLRRDLEEQLHKLVSNKVEISYEKERFEKLRKDAEFESQEIARLQHELEVERKALSMARSWAEEEAKRARDQAKALEEARERWSSQGIKVVVGEDLRQEEDAGVTWLGAGKEFAVEDTIDRGENLVDRLKAMAAVVSGKSRDTINKIIQSICHLIDILKERFMKASRQSRELGDAAISEMSKTLQNAQHTAIEYSSVLKGGMKRVAEDCREGVERLTQKFKT